jgi:predicted transcriptional regulator
MILNVNNCKSLEISLFAIIVMRPWAYPKPCSVCEMTLEEIFTNTLTSAPCVYLNQERDVYVATEMCVQYLESIIDSIVIRDNEHNVLGIVGGYDILNHTRKNPTRDFQYDTKVKDIMFKDLPIVEKTTTFKELMDKWTVSRRAFAIIPNSFQGYSPISARKMLEIGIRCKTNLTIEDMPKKKMITFQPDDSLKTVVDLMFENGTRKLLLEYSNQYISDRLVLKEISKTLKFQPDIENLLDVPINQVELDNVDVIKEDLSLNQICKKMYKMDHPYIIYKDISITPWDICNVLMKEKIVESYETESEKTVCPHCGKSIV